MEEKLKKAFRRGVTAIAETYEKGTNYFVIRNSSEVVLMAEIFDLGLDFITPEIVAELEGRD